MQRVAELVKQGAGVIERKKRGLALTRLREVHHVDDQGLHVAGKLLLLAQARHPGAALLGRAREIITEEQAAMAARGVAHLPHPHVIVPDRHVGTAFEAQPEQAVRSIERGLDHAVELEVWLDRGLVDVATRLAQLLRVVAPVPRRERKVLALCLHERLHGIAVGHGARTRRPPDPVEQGAHRLRRLRHGIVEAIVREGLVAEEPRPLRAQFHHLGDDRLVVGLAAAVAARNPGAEHLLAQVPARRELEERVGDRARGGHHVLAGHVALLAHGEGRRPHEIGQTRKIVLAIEHQRIVLLVRQHILAEARAERRQPLVDGGEPFLRRRIEPCAGTLEPKMVALEHPRLLGREAELIAAAMQRIHAAEQGLVHRDLVPVLGVDRRELALDLLDRIVRVRAREQVEHIVEAGELGAALLHRIDGVGKGGRGRIGGDCLDLGAMGGISARIGRMEMLGHDARERRHAERRGPWLGKRIVGFQGLFGDWVLLRHIRHMGFGSPRCTLAADPDEGVSNGLCFAFFRCERRPLIARLNGKAQCQNCQGKIQDKIREDPWSRSP